MRLTSEESHLHGGRKRGRTKLLESERGSGRTGGCWRWYWYKFWELFFKKNSMINDTQCMFTSFYAQRWRWWGGRWSLVPWKRLRDPRPRTSVCCSGLSHWEHSGTWASSSRQRYRRNSTAKTFQYPTSSILWRQGCTCPWESVSL